MVELFADVAVAERGSSAWGVRAQRMQSRLVEKARKDDDALLTPETKGAPRASTVL